MCCCDDLAPTFDQISEQFYNKRTRAERKQDFLTASVWQTSTAIYKSALIYSVYLLYLWESFHFALSLFFNEVSPDWNVLRLSHDISCHIWSSVSVSPAQCYTRDEHHSWNMETTWSLPLKCDRSVFNVSRDEAKMLKREETDGWSVWKRR